MKELTKECEKLRKENKKLIQILRDCITELGDDALTLITNLDTDNLLQKK